MTAIPKRSRSAPSPPGKMDDLQDRMYLFVLNQVYAPKQSFPPPYKLPKLTLDKDY